MNKDNGILVFKHEVFVNRLTVNDFLSIEENSVFLLYDELELGTPIVHETLLLGSWSSREKGL